MPRNKSLLKSGPVIEHNEIIKNAHFNIVPNRIRLLRLVNNLDIKVLAKALNVSPSMLQQSETQQKAVSVDLLTAIAKYFDVSMDYIMYQTDEIKPYHRNETLKTDVEELALYFDMRGE